MAATQFSTIQKEIVQAGPRDFTATVDGEYVGSRPTRLEAEALADGYAYALFVMQPYLDATFSARREAA